MAKSKAGNDSNAGAMTVETDEHVQSRMPAMALLSMISKFEGRKVAGFE